MIMSCKIMLAFQDKTMGSAQSKSCLSVNAISISMATLLT